MKNGLPFVLSMMRLFRGRSWSSSPSKAERSFSASSPVNGSSLCSRWWLFGLHSCRYSGLYVTSMSTRASAICRPTGRATLGSVHRSSAHPRRPSRTGSHEAFGEDDFLDPLEGPLTLIKGSIICKGSAPSTTPQQSAEDMAASSARPSRAWSEMRRFLPPRRRVVAVRDAEIAAQQIHDLGNQNIPLPCDAESSLENVAGRRERLGETRTAAVTSRCRPPSHGRNNLAIALRR